MRHLLTSSLALAAALASSAVLADSYSINSLAGTYTNTHSFSASYSGSFTDYYSFTLGGTSSLSGQASETDGKYYSGFKLVTKDLEVTSLSLSRYVDNAWTRVGDVDVSPESFFFSPLSAGSYKLTLGGSVKTNWTYGLAPSTNQGVSSYTLMASVTPIASTAPVASAAPEPAQLALTALGLAGVVMWSRRRQARQA